jgi:MFS family permease
MASMTETQAEDRRSALAGGARLSAFFHPLAARDFRLLWLGESVSLLGDQFYLVALPWLTLQLTGSGLALGTVLMAAAIPRLLFMLVGGALADRLSPRTLLLASNAVRALLATALAALVLTSGITLWSLYLFAFAFGVADAFFQPAMLAIVPRLVDREALAPSNALLQITGQLTEVLGPALAGLVIAAGATWVAFAIDAVTFVFTTLLLLLIHGGRPAPADTAAPRPPSNLLREMLAGLRSIWREPQMRTFLLLIMGINFFLIGPVGAGLPALALLRFQSSATAFGALLTAFGVGALLGSLIAGATRPPRALGQVLLALSTAIGVGLALLGLAPNVLGALAIVAAIGGVASFINIHILAWLQQRTPPALLGRVMSVVMLAALGLDPLSRAVAGIVLDINVAAMFGAAGALLVLLVLAASTSRAAREIGLEAG